MPDFYQPTSPTITNPVNLDSKIQALQLDLSSRLSWLDEAFGRAYRARRTEAKGKSPYFYPEVFKSNSPDSKNRYIEVSPNNKGIGTHCFFYSPDPAQHGEVESPNDPQNPITYQIHLIFWGNLDKISLVPEYRFTELLKQDIRFILKSHSDFKILSEFEQPENVFRDFSFNELESQYFKNPYFGLKFELELSFLPDCNLSLNTY